MIESLAVEMMNITGPFLLVAFLLLMVVIYMLPTIVTFARGLERKSSIAALNLLTGWTLAGWIVSFVWAVKEE
ncbi:superinfection immunity protein [Salicibibacter halophilus]|uniref:Superinfection immunity protein n=1 Tax=Salicibibacter halophilus TaxID=2502791 RepID=A0A514LKB3_9BACI|nr:superinfection immunity protein [Salicibibacter halophilus]QDI92306.1 superinfection immunity protein [Salicibibacter halophilus]